MPEDAARGFLSLQGEEFDVFPKRVWTQNCLTFLKTGSLRCRSYKRASVEEKGLDLNICDINPAHQLLAVDLEGNGAVEFWVLSTISYATSLLL
ncbi:hypothetical protein BDW22DRAFT_1364504 [Trametopsis cervina]|nr:hypothetical protein BDW22DRAFT_1364504 [Trametopsis cervina]